MYKFAVKQGRDTLCDCFVYGNKRYATSVTHWIVLPAE